MDECKSSLDSVKPKQRQRPWFIVIMVD
uniref:Uncharacterized protein n=1 Tax=Tetranychus urticae TaxID=32264 RepID=T1K216_TETUR